MNNVFLSYFQEYEELYIMGIFDDLKKSIELSISDNEKNQDHYYYSIFEYELNKSEPIRLIGFSPDDKEISIYENGIMVKEGIWGIDNFE